MRQLHFDGPDDSCCRHRAAIGRALDLLQETGARLIACDVLFRDPVSPENDRLLVEARVKPKDIAFLRPGQLATVKLTAYDFSIYGGFPATLDYISADSVLDEKKQESHYLVRVRTTGDGPKRDGKMSDEQK